jgi:hypothetical protein
MQTMTDVGLALGAAIYHDHDLSVRPDSLLSIIRAVFGERSLEGEYTQSILPAGALKYGKPSRLHLARLANRIDAGEIARVIIETVARTPDCNVRVVIADVTPDPLRREPLTPRDWKYDISAGFGSNPVAALGRDRLTALLVELADCVQAKAGVIHWANSASYASGLAMGAGGGVPEAQERKIAHSYYQRDLWGPVIRGPSWGTFLSACHVEQMGGIGRLERESGCARVVALRSGGAFLQLTPTSEPLDVDRDDDPRLLALARFLAPICVPSRE